MAIRALRALLRLLADAAGPTYAVPLPPGSLAICRCCGADMVVPVLWDAQSDYDWWMRLRCGACGFTIELVIDDEAAETFDRQLRRQTAEIGAALAASERERMTDDLHALKIALDRDLIDARDFDG